MAISVAGRIGEPVNWSSLRLKGKRILKKPSKGQRGIYCFRPGTIMMSEFVINLIEILQLYSMVGGWMDEWVNGWMNERIA